MARKTKESEKITKQEEQITSITNSATSSRKKVVSSLAKNNSVKSKTTTTKKVTAQTKKKSSSKKESAKLEKEVIATTSEKTTKSKSKKATPSKKTTKTKTTTSMKKSKTASPEKFAAEYYDFPDKYNITMVKILAQTPKTLFIYWEISEDDIKSYTEKYGENFFEITKPILTVYNDTLNYSFEVEVNDFANSWYLNINDSKCNYHVEFGRKPIPYIQNSIKKQPINENISSQNENTNNSREIIPDYIYLTSSNEMSVPNNKILFNFKNPIKFKNVKTGFETQKDFNFISNLGILNINSLYKKLFPTDYYNLINESNVTINNLSSGIFSSQFK